MIYLNYAAMCPTRPEAEQEMEMTQIEFKKHLYSESGIQWYRTKIKQCRKAVAGLLHVSHPSAIAFVPNASSANYFLLSAIDWQPGDSILSSTHENPSIRNQLLTFKHKKVKIQFLTPMSSPQQFLTSIEQALRESKFRAIVLSHVSHVDGRIFPIAGIAALAKEHKCLLLVDGAQAAGHISVNFESLDCDAYFFSGYKWCEGPLGTGGLIISKRLLEHIPSVLSKFLPDEQPHASRFEIGTHNIGLIAGLAKACEIKKQEGLHMVFSKKIRQDAKRQLEHMKGMKPREWDGPHAPGILTFESLDHTILMEVFKKENVAVKQFMEYPEGETPAIRISWLNGTDAHNVTKTLDHLKE